MNRAEEYKRRRARKRTPGEEERQRPGRVEAYQKEKEQETKREKKLKRMPGSGRARPGPTAAEWCGTESGCGLSTEARRSSKTEAAADAQRDGSDDSRRASVMVTPSLAAQLGRTRHSR